MNLPLVVTGAVSTYSTNLGSVIFTAVTNGVGVATVAYTAPGAVSFYDYAASFDGNAVYAAKTGSSRVGVGLRVTSLVVPGLSPLALTAGMRCPASASSRSLPLGW